MSTESLSKYRPPVEDRWGATNDRTEPVRIDLHTEWLYSDDRPDRKPPTHGDDCACCPGRHAFSRGGRVVRSDVPSPYANMNDVAAHLWRAIEAFGDDADLVIEVRRPTPEEKP